MLVDKHRLKLLLSAQEEFISKLRKANLYKLAFQPCKKCANDKICKKHKLGTKVQMAEEVSKGLQVHIDNDKDLMSCSIGEITFQRSIETTNEAYITKAVSSVHETKVFIQQVEQMFRTKEYFFSVQTFVQGQFIGCEFDEYKPVTLLDSINNRIHLASDSWVKSPTENFILSFAVRPDRKFWVKLKLTKVMV